MRKCDFLAAHSQMPFRFRWSIPQWATFRVEWFPFCGGSTINGPLPNAQPVLTIQDAVSAFTDACSETPGLAEILGQARGRALRSVSFLNTSLQPGVQNGIRLSQALLACPAPHKMLPHPHDLGRGETFAHEV
jgi:hypothetical protein